MCRQRHNKMIFSLLSVLLILYCFLIVINAQQISSGVIAATYRCINIIIPSLFAFMAVSQIIIKSRLYSYISKPFYPITKYILKMPDELFFIFLLGNISGYPIGISLLSIMVKEKRISKKTAEVMSCYCYAGGPAFITGAIGIAVFSSSRVGIIIFFAILISNLIMAVIMNRLFKISESGSTDDAIINSEIIVTSVENAGRALFKMCGLIIFFSTFMSLLDTYKVFKVFEKHLGNSSNITVIIKSLLEISSISELTGSPYKLIPIITCCCGFGGICVILQILSLYEKQFSLRLFYATRPLSCMIQFAVSSVLLCLFKADAIAVSTIKPQIIVDFNNFIPSICLIMMIFVILLRKRLAFSKEL